MSVPTFSRYPAGGSDPFYVSPRTQKIVRYGLVGGFIAGVAALLLSESSAVAPRSPGDFAGRSSRGPAGGPRSR